MEKNVYIHKILQFLNLKIVKFFFVISILFVLFGIDYLKLPQIKKNFVEAINNKSIKKIVIHYIDSKKNTKKKSYRIVINNSIIIRKFLEISKTISEENFLKNYAFCKYIYSEQFLITLVFSNNEIYSFLYYYDFSSKSNTDSISKALVMFLDNTKFTSNDYMDNLYPKSSYCIENLRLVSFLQKEVVKVVTENPSLYKFNL